METICRMAKKQLKNSVLSKRNGKFTTETPSSASLQNIFQTQINQFQQRKFERFQWFTQEII